MDGFLSASMPPWGRCSMADMNGTAELNLAQRQRKRNPLPCCCDWCRSGSRRISAPVVGPTLGGWISDNWSWQWCFLINAPVGVLALALITRTEEGRDQN